MCVCVGLCCATAQEQLRQWETKMCAALREQLREGEARCRALAVERSRLQEGHTEMQEQMRGIKEERDHLLGEVAQLKSQHSLEVEELQEVLRRPPS